ncbi:lipopolysaccharide kinase InaA family protein [Pseudomonas sp. GV071]|uniref:lipopolysaccharide kinase InaA family protein n=1 Tax=Pseudomonas sp. GV071 TaxID=2135754 RepID=UPI000D3A2F2A|nr:lipopolysaccharide kinase InaA family protein [Pseudomonas sp. GV071]PTQ72212.1 lipopolysaccharide kinase (Kdo/WaaP) family protein [Pseudomonas sp. GV071]
MRHLKRLTRNYTEQNIRGITFYLEPGQQVEIAAAIEQFFAQPEQRITLDPPEDTRLVCLLQGEQKWVLKYNRLLHWKKQLQNYLGIRKAVGLHDLTNEFINLSVVSAKADYVPRIAAYGYKARFPFLREEYLLIGFMQDHQSVDGRLTEAPEQASMLLPQVFRLFSRMLDDGFVHMDPHPKNVLIAPNGELKLIDFECCAQSVINRDASLGFLLGYVFTYWLKRFISMDDYRACCEAYLSEEQAGLDRQMFDPVFERFLSGRVSRSTRYSILTSAQAQAEFVRANRQ